MRTLDGPGSVADVNALLLLTILAGALLGTYFGKLPRWTHYLALVVLVLAAILVLRGEISPR